MASRPWNHMTISPLTAAMFAVLGAVAGAAFVLAGPDIEGLNARCVHAPSLSEPVFYLPAQPAADRIYLPMVAEIPQSGGPCQL